MNKLLTDILKEAKESGKAEAAFQGNFFGQEQTFTEREFARLIILECISTLNGMRTVNTNDTLEKAQANIRRRFSLDDFDNLKQ